MTVQALLKFDDQADGSTVYTDEVGSLTWANESGSTASIDTTDSKFGAGSLECVGDGGIEANLVTPLDNVNAEWTIELWVKKPTGTGNQVLLEMHHDNSTFHQVYWNSSNQIHFYSAWFGSLPAITVTPDEWHHIAIFTKAGEQAASYMVDGEVKGTLGLFTTGVNFNQIKVGCQTTYNAQFIGSIDSVRFTDVCLYFYTAYGLIPTADFTTTATPQAPPGNAISPWDFYAGEQQWIVPFNGGQAGAYIVDRPECEPCAGGGSVSGLQIWG